MNKHRNLSIARKSQVMRTLALALDVKLNRDQTTLTYAANQELASAVAKPQGEQETIQWHAQI